MEENMKIITVYGSLLSDLGNHQRIATQKMLSEEVIEIPYKMISLGGFPGLIETDEMHKIKVETYLVTPIVYESVEQLEGYPRFYEKLPVTTSVGNSEVYILNEGQDREYVHYPEVNKVDGVYNWKSHRQGL